MIELRNISKQYEKHSPFIFQNFNLKINEGCFFGLLGPNGCGKTTLISIMAGLLKADSGEVLINGLGLKSNLSALKALIGLVSQEVALYQNLSLIENLKLFGKLYGLHGKLLQERIKYCLDISQLTQNSTLAIKKYSGGMKRRANLVVSLLHKPKILLLDEPTVNVDPQSRNMIFETLRILNQQGVTLVYTTHYLEEAEELCTEVAIMDAGKIIQHDKPKFLIQRSIGAKNLGDVFLNLTGRHLRD